MYRRDFLAASTLALAALPATAQERAGPAPGPALLTVTGEIAHANRGPLNPALDQMMYKQNAHFEKAYTFDFGALMRLAAVTIRPTLEYDAKQHLLRGPLLSDVLKIVGGPVAGSADVLLQAVDGYAVVVSLAELETRGFIVATHLDGEPMALGGLGPLWAVYEPDRFPDMAAKPLNERYVFCPWALYRIDIRTGRRSTG